MTAELLTLLVFLLCAVVGFLALVLAATVCKLQELSKQHNKLVGHYNAFVSDLLGGRILFVLHEIPRAELPPAESQEWWQKGEPPPWNGE